MTEAETFCIKLLISVIRQVCDGEMTLEELKDFRNTMENEQYSREVQ